MHMHMQTHMHIHMHTHMHMHTQTYTGARRSRYALHIQKGVLQVIQVYINSQGIASCNRSVTQNRAMLPEGTRYNSPAMMPIAFGWCGERVASTPTFLPFSAGGDTFA